MDYFEYKGKKYPYKAIYFQSDENAYIVATEELEHILLPDGCTYGSEEVRFIDEQIFFFVDDDILTQPDDFIEKYITESL